MPGTPAGAPRIQSASGRICDHHFSLTRTEPDQNLKRWRTPHVAPSPHRILHNRSLGCCDCDTIVAELCSSNNRNSNDNQECFIYSSSCRIHRHAVWCNRRDHRCFSHRVSGGNGIDIRRWPYVRWPYVQLHSDLHHHLHLPMQPWWMLGRMYRLLVLLVASRPLNVGLSQCDPSYDGARA